MEFTFHFYEFQSFVAVNKCVTNKETMQLKKIVLLKNAKEAYIIEENNEVYTYKKLRQLIFTFLALSKENL